MLQHTTSSPAPIMILPVQRKLANLADIPSALSLSSEEQYSKFPFDLIPFGLIPNKMRKGLIWSKALINMHLPPNRMLVYSLG